MFYDEEYYSIYKLRYKLKYFTSIMYEISNKSKYAKYYVDLCENIILKNYVSRKNARDIEGYVESHHIVPVSFNKTFEKSKFNIIHCSAREHFILHKLLSKMFIYVNHSYHVKMLKAVTMFNMKNSKQKRLLTSRDYEYIRKCYIESNSGETSNFYGKDGTVKGKKCYNNGIVNKFFYEGLEEEGYEIGSRVKNNVKRINNGKEDRNIGLYEDIPDGWVIGSVSKGRESALKGKEIGPYSDERKENISKSIIGRKAYNNGIKEIWVKECESIPDGYVKGRLPSSIASFTEKVYCDICGTYSSNMGNVTKHKKICRG